MPGALDGIRVIDFGQYIAGPMAAMLLGDQGADVIRIDPPGGPRLATPANATWNRNKRSIVLDLKAEGDQDTARRLVESADVVIENFRPGVLDRLGLGAEAMTTANPGLIYCSLPGFADDDPRAGVAAWEGIIGAATGTYRASPATGKPVYTALPFSSAYGAFLAAVSVAVALNAREGDGAGQVIQVPLFDATYAAIGIRGLRVHGEPDGSAMRRNALVLGWTRQFECKDGRWFMYHAGNQNVPEFFEATGAAAWATGPAWEALVEDERHEKIAELFRTRTAQEWETFCEEVGTEGAVCRTTAEWLEDPGALGSRIVVDGEDPQLGTIRGPGINVRMSATPGAIRTPRPAPDQHRAEILSSLDGARPAPAGVPAARPALEGIRVLDLTIILAGPTCGRTLAEFGAEVIKIDSPHRKQVVFHNDVNRGKESIVLDLKTPDGLEVFWQLVESADVVVQNFRKGVAERLGIGYDDVRARKPDIIYASLNTYGREGPYAGRPGHEQIAQAASGMQVRYGGKDGPMLAPFAVNDYGTGLMGAYGVLLALFERQRTGRGQHVDTALAYTATMLQSALLPAYAGKTWDEPGGQDALGEGPFYSAYQAADGWLFLAATVEQLAKVEALRTVGRDPGEAGQALEEGFRSATVAEWVERLSAAGVSAHRVIDNVRELMEDPWAIEHGLSITRDHDEIGPVTTVGPSPRLSRTPPGPGKPAPKPGSDAREILARIGRDGDLDQLVEAGVVVTGGITAG